MLENGKVKVTRRSEGEWRSILSRYQASGLGVKAFCRQESISAVSFYRWGRILGERIDSDDRISPAFVDLGALNSEPVQRLRLDLKLDFGDGLVLHLVRG